MSGGRFNYLDGSLASEMFNYLSPSYGKSGFVLAELKDDLYAEFGIEEGTDGKRTALRLET